MILIIRGVRLKIVFVLNCKCSKAVIKVAKAAAQLEAAVISRSNQEWMYNQKYPESWVPE